MNTSASQPATVRWLVRAHQGVAFVLRLLGIGLIAIGLYLGAFAWLNDGAVAGLALILVTGGFGAAFLAGAICFRMIANAHAQRSPQRWWLQVLLPLAAWVAFGLAATLSSLAEDLVR